VNRSQSADYPKMKPRDDESKPRVQIVYQQSPPSKSGVKKQLPTKLVRIYIHTHIHVIRHKWC